MTTRRFAKTSGDLDAVAIVVTLANDLAPAASSPARDLSREYSAQSERLTTIENTVARTRAEPRRREIADVRASTSWRMTALLRALSRLTVQP